ncbi:MAG: hypothetical protein ACI8UD_000695, partial [Planctomycetota bacterium]
MFFSLGLHHCLEPKPPLTCPSLFLPRRLTASKRGA